jgi:hypothetical protein
MSAAGGNLIVGNYLGTDTTGTTSVPNLTGIEIGNASSDFPESPDNVIGGVDASSRNLVSGNAHRGILITSGAGNKVIGNYIGVTADGTAALPNGNGIQIFTSGNQIGGVESGSGNVISGNSNAGLMILLDGALGNVVRGNFIGTGPLGTSAIPNVTDGIVINSADGNQIGGSQAANRIAFNQGAGVLLLGGTRNLVSANSIDGNLGLGIDLDGDGVTSNDVDDTDIGTNTLQNFPLIASATVSGSTTTVQGTLNSVPNGLFVLEFFSSASCDESGSGEGQTYLGSIPVNTNGSGVASFTATLRATTPGQSVTATSTDGFANTSEFSACRAVTGG